MFGREAGGEGVEGESEQQDQNKAGESVPVSLVWALGHVLRPHQGEDHEAHGCVWGGWFQGCCPEPVRVEHLGHHAWGWGTVSCLLRSGPLGATISPPASSASGKVREGGGQRWFSAGLLACGGVLDCCPSVPLTAHL